MDNQEVVFVFTKEQLVSFMENYCSITLDKTGEEKLLDLLRELNEKGAVNMWVKLGGLE